MEKQNQKAVLVIDMLQEFIHGTLKCEQAHRIIQPLRRLLETARERDIPVIFVNDSHTPDDPELRRWGEHAMAGTKGAQVIPELGLTDRDLVVTKQTYSGFYQTRLEELLKARGVLSVYLTGVHAHICVRHTAAAAFYRGYNIIAVEDCLEAFTEEDRAAGMKDLEFAYGARLETIEQVIEDWEAEAVVS